MKIAHSIGEVTNVTLGRRGLRILMLATLGMALSLPTAASGDAAADSDGHAGSPHGEGTGPPQNAPTLVNVHVSVSAEDCKQQATGAADVAVELTKEEILPNGQLGISGNSKQYVITTDQNGGGDRTVFAGTYLVGPQVAYGQLKSVHQKSLGKEFFAVGQSAIEVTLDQPEDVLSITMVTPCTSSVRVKILTTQSCTTGTDSTSEVAGGTAVYIGNQRVQTDYNGTAEIEVPAGKQRVSAELPDTTFGYVNQNGKNIFYTPEGVPGYWVTLSNGSEVLEFRMLNCDSNGLRKTRARVDEVSEATRGEGIFVKRTKASGRAFVGMLLRDGDEVTVVGKAKITWLDGNVTFNFTGEKGPVKFVMKNSYHPQWSPGVYIYGPSVGTRILRGFIDFFMPPSDGKKYKFEPSTGTVWCTVKGTVFRLEFDDQTAVSTVSVERGDVLATPTNPKLQPITLHSGQQIQVGPDTVGPITAFAGHLGFPASAYDGQQAASVPGATSAANSQIQPLSSFSSPTALACKSACDDNSNCKAWSWTRTSGRAEAEPNRPRAKEGEGRERKDKDGAFWPELERQVQSRREAPERSQKKDQGGDVQRQATLLGEGGTCTLFSSVQGQLSSSSCLSGVKGGAQPAGPTVAGQATDTNPPYTAQPQAPPPGNMNPYPPTPAPPTNAGVPPADTNPPYTPPPLMPPPVATNLPPGTGASCGSMPAAPGSPSGPVTTATSQVPAMPPAPGQPPLGPPNPTVTSQPTDVNPPYTPPPQPPPTNTTLGTALPPGGGPSCTAAGPAAPGMPGGPVTTATSTGSSAPAAPGGTDGLRLVGRSLKGYGGAKINAGFCKTYCDKDSTCVGWTYVKPATSGVATRQDIPGPGCYLMTTITARLTDNCCTSGEKPAGTTASGTGPSPAQPPATGDAGGAPLGPEPSWLPTGPDLVITSVNPPQAAPGTDAEVTVTGQNFTDDAIFGFENLAIQVESFSINGATQAKLRFKVPANAKTGATLVYMTTPDGRMAEAPFTIGKKPAATTASGAGPATAQPQPPTTGNTALPPIGPEPSWLPTGPDLVITSVSPPQAAPGTDTEVTVIGQNFESDAIFGFDNLAIQIESFSINGANQAKLRFKVPADARTGATLVYMTTPDGRMAQAPFTVAANTPAPPSTRIPTSLTAPTTRIGPTVANNNPPPAGQVPSTLGPGKPISNLPPPTGAVPTDLGPGTQPPPPAPSPQPQPSPQQNQPTRTNPCDGRNTQPAQPQSNPQQPNPQPAPQPNPWTQIIDTLGELLQQSANRPAAPSGTASGVNAADGVNLPGYDYSSFYLNQPRWDLCQSYCLNDQNCRAFTYVKPRYQGDNAACFLKTAYSQVVRDACCVSGVKNTPSANNPYPQGQDAVNIAGTWIDRGGAWVYQITQNGNSFHWNRTPPETADGTISGTALSAQWNGVGGYGQATARVTQFDANGVPIRIEWSNGEVFVRPGTQPAAAPPVRPPSQCGPRATSQAPPPTTPAPQTRPSQCGPRQAAQPPPTTPAPPARPPQAGPPPGNNPGASNARVRIKVITGASCRADDQYTSGFPGVTVIFSGTPVTTGSDGVGRLGQRVGEGIPPGTYRVTVSANNAKVVYVRLHMTSDSGIGPIIPPAPDGSYSLTFANTSNPSSMSEYELAIRFTSPAACN